METKTFGIKLADLSKPFDDIHWRIQQCKDGKAICIPYIDARQVFNRLDETLSPVGWQTRHKQMKESIFAEIGIHNPETDEWIWKSDVGSETYVEAKKGEVSDSIKRAAVQWGIGRDLYSMQPIVLRAANFGGKWYPVDVEKGIALVSGLTLTAYINHHLAAADGETWVSYYKTLIPKK